MKFTEIWENKSKDDNSNAVLCLCDGSLGEKFEVVIMPLAGKSAIIFFKNGEYEIWDVYDVDSWLNIADYTFIRTTDPEEEFGNVEWNRR